MSSEEDELGTTASAVPESYGFGKFGWITDPEGNCCSFGNLSPLINAEPTTFR